ncbi:MAG: transketolase family protein [Planctomycetota bacterium]|jgi:transketolase
MSSTDIAPREAWGKTLVELGEKNPDIVVLDADINPATLTSYFKQSIPERFIQVGIAEQNMTGIAAGLATVGFIPFATTLACFASRRAADQVAISVAYPNLNVKIMGGYPGLFVGKNGATHQSLEDIAIMRSMANMVVVQPADAVETREVVKFAVEHKGPVYLRIGRDPVPQVVPDDYKFQLGKAYTVKDGNDITIIACGAMIEDSLIAARKLEKKGISARLINMSSIKPIDEDAIVKAAQETGRILTVETHNVFGGLGSAVTEVVCDRMPVKVRRMGVQDKFGKSGTNDQMKEKFGLTAAHIEKEVESFLKS